jgi:hypothetical protein
MSGEMSDNATAFWPRPPAHLFCVLDAAADRHRYLGLRDLAWADEVAPLYDGPAAAQLADTGPYLLALDPDGASFDWLRSQPGLDESAIYLAGSASFAEVRGHLRRLTRARTEDGRVLLFRFYDPLVLGAFLPTCDDAQLVQVFGPLEQIMLTDSDGRMLSYSWSGGNLRIASVDRTEPETH